MKKIRSKLWHAWYAIPAALYISLCAIAAVEARGIGPLNARAVEGTLISAATLDANRSYTVQRKNQGAWGVLVNYISVTDDNTSISDITMTCYAGYDGNAPAYTIQDCSIVSGACTSNDATWSKDPAPSATTKWVWRVDIEGLEDVKCEFVPTGGAVADTISVDVELAVK